MEPRSTTDAVVTAAAHRRHDPLRDSWVLVSAGRDKRPWRGQIETPPAVQAMPYDPSCPLCPGNTRASGAVNPVYTGPFVFENDFPALRPDTPPGALHDRLHRAESASGVARVLCYSPTHDQSLASMGPADRQAVIRTWAEQSAELGERYRWVQAFENRGAAMGASSPHPHGQLWASTSFPTEATREDATQRAWLEAHGRALLDDVRDQEASGPLEIVSSPGWLAVVPYWASWPFETLLIGPPGARRLPDLDEAQRSELEGTLGRLLRRYDALFQQPFPYSMGWHQAPFGVPDGETEHWRLHAHFYPPLLRAEARKFMVGYELLAEPQRDLTPEDAAERLRAALPDELAPTGPAIAAP